MQLELLGKKFYRANKSSISIKKGKTIMVRPRIASTLQKDAKDYITGTIEVVTYQSEDEVAEALGVDIEDKQAMKDVSDRYTFLIQVPNGFAKLSIYYSTGTAINPEKVELTPEDLKRRFKKDKKTYNKLTTTLLHLSVLSVDDLNDLRANHNDEAWLKKFSDDLWENMQALQGKQVKFKSFTNKKRYQEPYCDTFELLPDEVTTDEGITSTDKVGISFKPKAKV